MAEGTVYFDIESAQAALNTLSENAADFASVSDLSEDINIEVPKTSPIENKFSLAETSVNHGDIFGDYLAGLKNIYASFDENDKKYQELITKLQEAIASAQKAEQNGNVDRETSTDEDSPGSGGQGGTQSSEESGQGGGTTGGTVPGGEIPTGGTTGTDSTGSGGTTTGTGIEGGAAGIGAAGTAAGAIGGGESGSDSIPEEDIGGLGSPGEGTPFGDCEITKETIDSMTDEEKEKLRSKLKELGYTDEEIDVIFSGGGAAPSSSVDAVAEALEKALKDDPDLRQALIDKYGFDIFDENGNIDKEKLALALMMDGKNGQDGYSIIDLLQSQYGIDIVGSADFANLTSRLEGLIGKYPKLRQQIIDKYGFDIFNPDGTINRDKLALAMLIDGQSDSDDFDLLSFLEKYYDDDTLSELLGSVVGKNKPKSSKGKGMNLAAIAAGIGLAGAIGGGTALLVKNKKEEEEEEEESDDEELQNADDFQEDDKAWLHDYGLGLAATSDGVETISSSNVTSSLLNKVRTIKAEKKDSSEEEKEGDK